MPFIAKYSSLTIVALLIYFSFGDVNGTIRGSVMELYESFLGDLPLLYEQARPSFIAGLSFGQRVLGLLFGWFVVLFVLERSVALLLQGVRIIVRVAYKGKATSESSSGALPGEKIGVLK